MGIYDRDYYREPERRSFLPSNRTIVANLVIATVIVYLADIFGPLTTNGLHWLSIRLACTPDTLVEPWMWWQFLTYGFVHDRGT